MQSTKQDVIEKYGKPNEIFEKSGYYHYISTYNNTETAELSNDKGLLFDLMEFYLMEGRAGNQRH